MKGSSAGTVKKYGPFFRTIKNGKGLGPSIQADMDQLAASAVAGSGFKHYIYSAYGFSGSGKTTTLIHSTHGENPVLKLVTDFLASSNLENFKIKLYLNDLYGEIDDGGCPDSSKTIQEGKLSEYITAYKEEDLRDGISNDTSHIALTPSNPNKNPIIMKVDHLNQLPKLLTAFSESRESRFVSKMRKRFGTDEMQRFHIRTTPNNPSSSRAHTFIRLVITDTQEKVRGKVTLIDMAGSENVNVIQDMYFSQGRVQDARLGDFKSLETMQSIAHEQTVVMEWVPHASKAQDNKGMKRCIDTLLDTLQRVEFKDVLHRTHFGTAYKNGTILGTPLLRLFKGMFTLPTDKVEDFPIIFAPWMQLYKTYSEKEFNVPTMKDLVGTVLQVPAGLMRYLALIKSMDLLEHAWLKIGGTSIDDPIDETIGKAESDFKALVTQFSANAWVNEKTDKLRRQRMADHLEGLVGWLDMESDSGLYKLMRTSHIFQKLHSVDTLTKDPLNGTALSLASIKMEFDLLAVLARLATFLHAQYTGCKEGADNARTELTKQVKLYENESDAFQKAVDFDSIKEIAEAEDSDLMDDIDRLMGVWKAKDDAKTLAMTKVHCPLRFQGNYIQKTLERDLATYLETLQFPSTRRPASESVPAWVRLFLTPTAGEDVKFVQFVNIRADFNSDRNMADSPQMKSFADGAESSLILATF
jgi:hypothetical protein